MRKPRLSRLRLSLSLSIVLGLVPMAGWSAPQSAQCHILFQKTPNHGTSKSGFVLPGDGFEDVSATKIDAAWEISRAGLAELSSELYGFENFLYYLGTAIMSRENLLSDGGGGGGKTFAMRKVFEAQMAGMRGQSEAERRAHAKDMVDLVREVRKIAEEERETISDPKNRLFTIQFHQLLSESAILGGPNPLKFVKDGEWEIDYSQALIAEKNIFAILDEVEKAPPALQMTLLSILNERQALAGNKVIQTLLESVSATTNATLGQLVSEGEPHEIGGRRALVDRFTVKFHVVNVSASAQDAFLFLEKVGATRGQKKYTVIDLRNLRALLKKIEIPKEVLDAAAETALQMDLIYTNRLNEAQREAAQTGQPAKFYPPFSGSIRVNSKVVSLWTSGFLMRQLLKGVPAESMRLQMTASDLVDLAPALLQGGPDEFVSKMGRRIQFLQFDYGNESDFTVDVSQADIAFPKSNVGWSKKTSQLTASERNLTEHAISTGHYDPATQVFSYQSAQDGQMRRLYFDVKQRRLNIPSAEVARELGVGLDLDQVIFVDEAKSRRYENLNARLARAHEAFLRKAKGNLETRYEATGKIENLLNGQQSLLRTESKEQLAEIKEFQSEFLAAVNSQISRLSRTPLTRVDAKEYRDAEKHFKAAGDEAEAKLRAALKTGSEDAIIQASAESAQLAFQELTYHFRNSATTVEAIFKTIAARRNLMLYGPPGSAKTMLSRMILNRELESIGEAQLADANKLMAHILPNDPKQSGAVWIRQFHPMSTEGDIVGRLDLKAIEQGKGYTYNRTGSLSARDVFFALLDEFEKAPPGVRTSLLSLMNERKLFNGDPVDSNLIAMIITTNSTPGEFMVSQGSFSTAFPIHDRIQWKAYAFNKLAIEDLKDFYARIYLGIKPELHSPLFLSALSPLNKRVQYLRNDRKLLAAIYQDFMSQAVAKSDTERQYHLSDSNTYPGFFMNTRGESFRSLASIVFEELSATVQMNRVLAGTPATELTQPYTFQHKDLESFAEMFLTANFAYSVKAEYGSDGILTFRVVEKDISGLQERLDTRERESLEQMKWEAENLVRVLHNHIQKVLREQVETIQLYPQAYKSIFVDSAKMQTWLNERRGQ
ncbi:MAG: AAA family ATPase [Bdellovibrionaceae bacterium]|nr:AAA family ATPase [Pseudobdellovibrionaceae bacterium]